MTAQMTFGPGPLRVRTNPTGDRISLHLESDDWREAVTITRTRNELVDLVSQITVAITSHPLVPSDPDYLPDCDLGWGCTDLKCAEHGERLAAGTWPPAPPPDRRPAWQIRDEEDEAAAAHQQMIEGQR
jgi:hypothetical protein